MSEEIPKNSKDRMNAVLEALGLKDVIPQNKEINKEAYYTGFLDALNRSDNTNAKEFQEYLQSNENA
ncbi:MAG: hypothetical protein P8L77_02600, partial [Gammaproteobacteria bacterium]|nr:hypothetical protein [Gammaproteobacteria bacterium]